MDAASALLDLPDNLEEKIPLDADHSSCVKFDTRGQKAYMSVRVRLQQFEKAAQSEVAARFRKCFRCGGCSLERLLLYLVHEMPHGSNTLMHDS